MNDVTLNSEAPALERVPVRMDRSRSFATVHGERGPSDLHAGVHFYQDGIPFDAQGFLLFDHPDLKVPGAHGDKIRALVERKLKKAASIAAKQPPKPAKERDVDSDPDADESDADAEDDLLDPVNLEAWLRGEQEVEWNDVSQEIARRFKVRKSKVEDAVAFLVNEQRVVAKDQLRRKFQKFAEL